MNGLSSHPDNLIEVKVRKKVEKGDFIQYKDLYEDDNLREDIENLMNELEDIL